MAYSTNVRYPSEWLWGKFFIENIATGETSQDITSFTILTGEVGEVGEEGIVGGVGDVGGVGE